MRKLLYIDDETINLELFEINYRRTYEVLTCQNPLNAMDIITENNISVVVSDYKMPEMNGLQLIEHIKENKPDTICIMLSGYLEREISKESSSVFRHIMKPYKKEELRIVIEEAFSSLNN